MRESTAFTVEKTVSEGHISGENLAEDVVGIGFLHETAELTEKKGPCLSTTHAMCPFTLNRFKTKHKLTPKRYKLSLKLSNPHKNPGNMSRCQNLTNEELALPIENMVILLFSLSLPQ